MTDTIETTALALPQPEGITPAQFDAKVQEAHLKAATLKRIVEDAKLYANISGRKYLQVEAWQTIGQAYGYSARVAWSRELTNGWEARAEVVTPYGDVIGSAEAECGTKGDRPWDSRASYQQRSMAQTRAISKSLRSVLSWVVVLAGYEATPSDEMPKEEEAAPPPPQAPREPSAQTAGPSSAQITRLWAIARAGGYDKGAVNDTILAAFGHDSTTKLTREEYNSLCDQMEGHKALGDLAMGTLVGAGTEGSRLEPF